jgi:hypothetical protein
MILENVVGETIEEIEDGFINGQDDVWRFLEESLLEHNSANIPPQMAMMAKMKTSQ